MPQYQGVWTLEQQAQAQSNQQWVTDPNFKNTTLLLQADGTGSGSQNQTFLDGSTNNFFITRNGNTTQGSFSPFSQAPGYWSNYFGGSGNYFVTNTAVITSTTTTFTIEAWIYMTAAPVSGSNTPSMIGDIQPTSSAAYWGFGPLANGTLCFYWYDGASKTAIGNTTMAQNTWNHVAISVSSNAISLYVNGVQQTITGTSTLTNRSGTNGYAAFGQFATTASVFTGYVSNCSVLSGTAKYSSSFTPSTTALPTNTTNQTLLTCASNSFADINTATTAKTITPTGTPSIQAFGPFAPALQWTPDVVGGSGYFDGSGDYLSFASNSNLIIGTGDFTLECWVYPTSWANSNAAIAQSNQGSNGPQWGKYGANNNLGFCNAGVAWLITDGTLPTVNMWSHIAVTRSGTTLKMYLNGAQTGSTVTNSTNFSTALQNIGANAASEYFTGYISGFRMLKGTALYTGSTYTIPAAPLTAITNTQLLLNNTNAGIYDGKMANNLETVGNAQVSTSVVKYGSGSMAFDGTGDYLVARSSPLFALGTADFTVEFWIWINALPATSAYTTYFSTRTGGTGMDIQLFNNAGTYQFMVGNPTGAIISANNVLSTSTWTHIAATRQNGFFRLFVNGVVVASGASSQNFTDTGCYVACGVSGANQTNCYIDDLRVTNGVCRYIANFTPPQQALPRQ